MSESYSPFSLRAEIAQSFCFPTHTLCLYAFIFVIFVLFGLIIGIFGFLSMCLSFLSTQVSEYLVQKRAASVESKNASSSSSSSAPAAAAAVGETQQNGSLDLTVLVLDGTWQQARKLLMWIRSLQQPPIAGPDVPSSSSSAASSSSSSSIVAASSPASEPAEGSCASVFDDPFPQLRDAIRQCPPFPSIVISPSAALFNDGAAESKLVSLFAPLRTQSQVSKMSFYCFFNCFFLSFLHTFFRPSIFRVENALVFFHSDHILTICVLCVVSSSCLLQAGRISTLEACVQLLADMHASPAVCTRLVNLMKIHVDSVRCQKHFPPVYNLLPASVLLEMSTAVSDKFSDLKSFV